MRTDTLPVTSASGKPNLERPGLVLVRVRALIDTKHDSVAVPVTLELDDVCCTITREMLFEHRAPHAARR